MCGIAGKLYFKEKSFNRNKEIPLIHNALKKLYHRGPDDEGYIIDNNIWLAATRLSIIDLSLAGHQPMKNEDGNLFLVFNGEIYNYLELKKQLNKNHEFHSNTDSEVILHLYEEFGTDCLKFLRGMFAFALWDRKKREIFIARDRIGKKPLKYYFNKQFFIFASELKAFINHPQIPREIDWPAIKEFLTYQYVPAPRTGFKNIWKLPPAHYMRINSKGDILIRKYWNLDFSQKLDLPEDEWCNLVTNKLKESIKLRLRSDVPLGVHLSGGIDSSMITALAAQETNQSLSTFSIGFEESDYNELPYAKFVAKKYHSDHHEVVVKPDVIEILPKLVYQYEEPFADPSILPTWYLMQESQKYMKVALNGDGGDENFAGYQRYKAMKLFNLLKLIPHKDRLGSLFTRLYQHTKKKDLLHLAKVLFTPSSDYKSYYQDLISFIDSKTRSKLFTMSLINQSTSLETKYSLVDRLSDVNNLDKLDQLLYVDINTYLPDVLLTKVDIVSMGNSLEVRSPFLDYEFMELTAKMPSYLKLKNMQTKYLLKKIAKKIIPKKCLTRRKQGFLPPLEHWFRANLYEYIKSQLLDKQFSELNIFNKNILKQLIEEHCQYKANNAYILWEILCLKHWLNIWFKL